MISLEEALYFSLSTPLLWPKVVVSDKLDQSVTSITVLTLTFIDNEKVDEPIKPPHFRHVLEEMKMEPQISNYETNKDHHSTTSWWTDCRICDR